MRRTAGVFALLDVEERSSYQDIDPSSGQGRLFLDEAGRLLYGSVCMHGAREWKRWSWKELPHALGQPSP